MTDEEIEREVNRGYGEGYRIKILEVIRRKELILVRYKITAERDGVREWRIKGWGTKAMSGWDYPYRRKW